MSSKVPCKSTVVVETEVSPVKTPQCKGVEGVVQSGVIKREVRLVKKTKAEGGQRVSSRLMFMRSF